VSVTDIPEKAEQRARAEAALPKELHRAFDQLIDDFAVSAKIHTAEIVIEYHVLADLVRAGWRRVS